MNRLALVIANVAWQSGKTTHYINLVKKTLDCHDFHSVPSCNDNLITYYLLPNITVPNLIIFAPYFMAVS
jgi:hypothetical protein